MVSSRRIVGVVCIVAGCNLAGFPVAALAGENPYGDHPRLGGARGQLNSRIRRPLDQEVEVPDVLTLKGGVKREAYFLQIYGDRLVYYVKETSRSWLREEVSRSEVEEIDFEQYLDKDPVAPRKIEPARKQPVPKDDLLSGVFTARQGRRFQWVASFHSEIDKFLEFSEDASDYGSFELESTSLVVTEAELPHRLIPRGGELLGQYNTRTMPRDKHVRSHAVKAMGKYYLYAPGTINNDEWVLLLAAVMQNEVDHARDTSLFTTQVPDETFILYFSPEKRTFELAWSNIGGWTWSSLVGLRFERLEPVPAAGAEAGSQMDRADPKARSPRPKVEVPPRPLQLPSQNLKPILASLDEPVQLTRQSLQTLQALQAAPPAVEWRTNGWRRPPSRWASR